MEPTVDQGELQGITGRDANISPDKQVQGEVLCMERVWAEAQSRNEHYVFEELKGKSRGRQPTRSPERKLENEQDQIMQSLWAT